MPETLPTARDWWRDAVVYQVYPRSFADSDGDGIGDLPGVTSRAGYLRDLGVDAVWLSPFYPSALADGGYDVDDPRDVDPRLGTLADVDAMVAALHGVGIKVVVDVVANHSSDRHRWFREALAAGPGSPARARYHFRDGTGPDGSLPPSDWRSIFGGPAWTRVPDGQWYLHLFAPEQPDLDYGHPDVVADALATLRFWADRGVDGFRIDAATHLAKDLSEPMVPHDELPDPWTTPGVDHPYWDRDEIHDIFAGWRAVLDSYDPPRACVGEVGAHPDRRSRYAAATSLGQVFSFDMQDAPWRPAAWREVIADNLTQVARTGSACTWVLSSHDVVRHASRFGLPVTTPAAAREWVNTEGTEPPCDAALGARRARAASLLMLALPGSAYLYQGEELGLLEVADLPAEVLTDPAYQRSGRTDKGRDGCRVPLPWTADGPSFGFGAGGAHLPQPAWFAGYAVATQDGDPGSSLTLYRTALALRRRLVAELLTRPAPADTRSAADAATVVDAGPDVVHVVRPGGWHAVANLGAEPVPLPAGEVLVASGPLLPAADSGPGDAARPGTPGSAAMLLPSDTCAWVQQKEA